MCSVSWLLLVKLSALAKLVAIKTPLRTPLCSKEIAFLKCRAKSAYDFWFNVLFIWWEYLLSVQIWIWPDFRFHILRQIWYFQFPTCFSQFSSRRSCTVVKSLSARHLAGGNSSSLAPADHRTMTMTHNPTAPPHTYSDDTQIYGHCQPSDAGGLAQRVIVCIGEISAGMKANRLQLKRHYNQYFCSSSSSSSSSVCLWSAVIDMNE